MQGDFWEDKANAQAVINDYRPNPVNTVQDLTNFRDPDKVISNFLTKFRDEFLKTIPETTRPKKLSQLSTSNRHKREITVTVSII